MNELQKLPARLEALTLEISALRDETRSVREEIRLLRDETRLGDEETRRFMRVPHEDVIARIGALGDLNRPTGLL